MLAASVTDLLPSVPGFDFRGISDLVGNDNEVVLSILRAYHEDAGKAVGEIDNLVSSGDTDGAIEAFHKLKGSSGNFGATRICNLAETLEASLRQGHFDDEAYVEFKEALPEALAALEAAIS